MFIEYQTELSAALTGRYAIERELGRGGMATVYLADDVRHARKVAIKVLRPELAGIIGVDRFIREIRLTAGLQHPSIVPLLDSGTFRGPGGVAMSWYAMTYIAGESLRDRLRRESPLPVEEALRITEATAAALEVAHGQGVIHRDIKPENLLLAQGHVYVSDFGIAKALAEVGGEQLTSTGGVLGTPAYMSPEQAAADPVDARTDQYSLACVLYEMLSGEPPFTGPNVQAVLARRWTEPARSLRSVRGTVPAGVDAAVLRALERVPADRFPDVASFVRALRGAPVSARRSGARWPMRLAGVVGAAVLLGGVALGARAALDRRDVAAGTRDSVAMALYERGLLAYDRRTPAGVNEAVQSFLAALRRDSTYAEAWAGLAKAYVRASERGFAVGGATGDSLWRLAIDALDRAVIHDQGNAGLWVTKAIVSRRLDPTDMGPAIRAVRQALSIDPGNAVGWQVLGLSLAEANAMEDAMPAWRRSVAADPTYTQGLAFLALGHYWRRQYDSAAHWADSSIAVDPTYVLGRATAGYVAIERGAVPRARAALDAARRMVTDVELVNALAGSAMVEARAGDAGAARRILQQAESLAVTLGEPAAHTAVWMSQAHAALGDHDRAMGWLRRYSPAADLHFQLHLRCDPPFDPLAQDPRFRALLLEPRPPAPRGCQG